MVFTIVTVVFLPPSFAATFFGMDDFQSSDASSTQRTFWTVLGILSGLTYIIAGIGLFGANTSSAQLKLRLMKRLLKKYDLESMDDESVDSEPSDEEKVRSRIRKINSWFGKGKNIWMKSPKEPSDLKSDTQRGNQDSGEYGPPV
ncbi:hypothetical protein J3F84DRAFT_361710 [Trichoderma pleuroticola]